jgi:hypothetical protein
VAIKARDLGRTVVSQQRVAQRLYMRSTANVSQQLPLWSQREAIRPAVSTPEMDFVRQELMPDPNSNKNRF